MKPKKILNDPERAVEEFMEGLLLQYPTQLQRLEHHPVLLRARQWNKDDSPSPSSCVHLISGGGSGHEPSHAGWIGSGMLSAAVCGGIFASPSVAAVLAAIRAVATATTSGNDTTVKTYTNNDGVLLIIKNYTGDRLNFGVAAERANLQYGIPVRTVVVADDCALPRQKGITGARGLAGTVLVHKIVGAAAAAGRSLNECHALATRVCARMGTLGVALDAVTVPGASAVNDRLADETTIEIGLGIHGEAGLKQSTLLSADAMAAEMIQTIQSHGRIDDDKKKDNKVVPFIQPGDELVILVNNLGGTSNFEMSILARSCIQCLEDNSKYQAHVSRVLVGSYMTSFDMHGASLTILNVAQQPDLLQYLDAPCSAPAWQKADVWIRDDATTIRPSLVRVPEPATEAAASSSDALLPPCQIPDFAATASHMVQAAVTALADAEPTLTQYDTIVGDGDCGITLKRGATQILQELQNGTLDVHHPVSLFAGLSQAVSASMGGTSGILLELLLGKMAATLRGPSTPPQQQQDDEDASKKEITSANLVQAFATGVEAVKFYGGATVGSRTMMDALVPAAQASPDDSAEWLQAAAQAARSGANTTAAMDTALAGRSNYLSQESLQGTPDPGAVAVAIVLEACAAAATSK